MIFWYKLLTNTLFDTDQSNIMSLIYNDAKDFCFCVQNVH